MAAQMPVDNTKEHKQGLHHESSRVATQNRQTSPSPHTEQRNCTIYDFTPSELANKGQLSPMEMWEPKNRRGIKVINHGQAHKFSTERVVIAQEIWGEEGTRKCHDQKRAPLVIISPRVEVLATVECK